jgi:hypothetical protein
LRIVAALKVCSGMLALSWATASFAAPAGTASPEPPNPVPGVAAAKAPSIMISSQQTGLAGTCGGAAFDVNTVINVGSGASADVRLSVSGVGLIEEFTDETGKNIGPYAADYPTFHIPAFGGGLAPNTLITLTITTYSAPSLTGSVTFISTMVFDCTTGAVVRAPATAPGLPVPALSPGAIAALIALLALLGATRLRRPSRRRV